MNGSGNLSYYILSQNDIDWTVSKQYRLYKWMSSLHKKPWKQNSSNNKLSCMEMFAGTQNTEYFSQLVEMKKY